MLHRSHRLTEGREFARAVREGRRAGTSTMVLHLLADAPDPSGSVARVGFVVGRGVGPAVTRTRVKRRLRHLVRDRLARLPEGALLVVRALPPAGDASSPALGADLERALGRLLGPQVQR